jgi:nucleoside-diphosphate-sugar epimerase
MKVLVTGGTGFIGQHLVPALLAAGHDVALLVRAPRTDAPSLPPSLSGLRAQLQLTYADLRNFALTSRSVREVVPDAVVHLAARGATDPFLPPEAALRHNVSGTVHLLRACFESERGITRLLAARTPGETNPHSPYTASKAAAWAFCAMYAGTQGWPIVGATIFQAYGPGQSSHALVPAAVRAAQAGEDFPFTAGRQRRDWIYVGDVADALVQMVSANLPSGSSYDIGTGKAIAVRDVVTTIYELADRGGRPRPGLLPDRPNEPAMQRADTETTAEILGWRASLALKDGLAKLIAAASRN